MEEFKPVHGRGEGVRLGNQNVGGSNSLEEIVPRISTMGIDISDGIVAESMGVVDVQERLDDVQEKIMNWDSERLLAWDSEPEEAGEFLRYVDEVRELTEDLKPVLLKSVSPRARRIQEQACGVLELAMERLEEEFTRILIRSRQSPDFGRLSFQSTEEDHGDRDDGSVTSSNEESFERNFPNESSRSSSYALFEPVEPATVADLKCIADLMFRSGYGRECLQAYVSTRKTAVEDCFSLLRVENLSIQEVVAMDSKALHSKFKKWTQAVKAFTLVYLPSERKLCDAIFGSASATCFSNITKGSFFKILSFGEAIAISPPETEKLFGLLDMYECLADLMADLGNLFSSEEEDCADSVLAECRELLSRLGESVVACFFKFKDDVRRKSVSSPFPGGGPFNITKYVMNYISAMTAFSETLCSLLHWHEREHEEDAGSDETSALRRGLLSVVSILEEKISEKSRLYTDDALRYFFMMNNIHYMVNKVKGCELRNLLGDHWIRAHSVLVRQHALSYQRISWNPILFLFRDEGIFSHGSAHPSRSVLKERFKNFNLAFEEIYKIQTAWLIPDERLRDDVTISISLNVLQAYRIFSARYQPHLEGIHHRDRYVKYSVQDLEIYVLDLFKGSPKNLHPPR